MVTKTTGYQANGWTSPRLGVNIVEDMGQGLSAVGVWETNIATEGASTGTVRQAFAGVKGGFGQVTIGNQYTTEYNQGITVAGTVNSYGFGSSALRLAGSAKPTATAVHRFGEVSQANLISFTAPTMGGVTVTAFGGKAVSEQTGATGGVNVTDSNTTTMGLGANYATGPLTAALSYSENKIDNKAVTGSYIKSVPNSTIGQAPTVTTETSCTASATVACTTLTAAVKADTTKQKNWTASGTYTLGAAKLFAYYADREQSGNYDGGSGTLDYKTFNVGAQYTIGKFTPFAQYSEGKLKNATSTLNDLSSYQVGASYAFSKRTTGYAYVAQYKDDATKAANNTDSKKAEVTSVGISHNF
jgi:predicted porin